MNALNLLLLQETKLEKKEIIFIGDFNINYKAKKAPDTKKLVAWQNKYGFDQPIKKDTRCATTSRSIIDLIFTNSDCCFDSGVLHLYISDHQPIYFIRKKGKDITKKTHFLGRTYVNYNQDLLSDSLTNAIKLSFRDEKDPNKCWALMEDFLHTFLVVKQKHPLGSRMRLLL